MTRVAHPRRARPHDPGARPLLRLERGPDGLDLDDAREQANRLIEQSIEERDRVSRGEAPAR
ncbi:hypothetical protein [Streptomyces sp. NPDC012756]|uniref:hypothetical protein n=1 Tax=Streptomyces sp. NPDC012756 TaxID=3364847 RepID=UPI003697996B